MKSIPDPAVSTATAPVKATPAPRRQLRSKATILVYTKQAAAVWNGRPATAEQPNGRVGIALAASLIQLPLLLTANDNPLADHLLIQLEQGLKALREECEARITGVLGLLAERATMGVTTAIAESRDPFRFELEFGTPYHYMLIDALSVYDSAVRHLLTISLTGMSSSNKVRVVISSVSKDFSKLMSNAVRGASLLRKTTAKHVTRSGLREQLPEQLQALAQWQTLFGEIPNTVLQRTTLPEHARPLASNRLSLGT